MTSRGALRFWDVCSRGEQCFGDARVVPLIAFPAMERAVERRGERSAAVFGFKDVNGSIAVQQGAHHGEVAAPRSEVQNSLVVFQRGVGRPAVPEQEFDGAGIVAHSHADDATGSVSTEASEKCRMLLENLLSQGFIANLDGLNKTEPRGAPLHEKIKDRSVAELMGDLVWRLGHSEGLRACFPLESNGQPKGAFLMA